MKYYLIYALIPKPTRPPGLDWGNYSATRGARVAVPLEPLEPPVPPEGAKQKEETFKGFQLAQNATVFKLIYVIYFFLSVC